jgi:UPF0755 protein
MGDRTPEEREAARIERERKRAAREGRPLPAEPKPEPPVVADRPVEQARDPQETQAFDVAATWTEGRVAVAAPAEPEPAVEPAPQAPDVPKAHEPEVALGTRRIARHERARAAGRRGRGGPPAPPRGTHLGGAPRSPGRRWGRRVGALLAIAAVVVAGWFLWSVYQPGAEDGSGRVVVTVPRGATVSEIGDLLAGRGVIDSSFFFRLRAKLSGSAGDIKSGTFRLRADMSYGAALAALSTTPPPPPVIRITIPEGRSRRETAPLARQAGLRGSYLAASRAAAGFHLRRYGAPRAATLEGFLFPATYELRRGATARQLVREQLVAFRQKLAKVNLRYASSKNLTVFDVLTIASMVEREVMVARERPLVAAVIYNRLRDGMNLGIDATLRFALHDWTHPLTVSELASGTPYNTRNHPGLPPGPIGNPGLASIEAAAHPAKVPYLFYVVKPGTCGQHAFSSTDAQFQQDVQRYNDARDAAGGKSPTKC